MWEISHSNEAWECLQRGIDAQTNQWLAEACATASADARQIEIDEEADQHWDDDEWTGESFDWTEYYQVQLAELRDYAHDTLVDLACRWVEHWMLCSNGGFDFYIDSKGYYSINLSDYEEDKTE